MLKIYIDRLKDGQSERIDLSINAALLELSHEPDLIFADLIHLHGQAYLTDDHLILQLKITTVAKRPCKICTELVKISLDFEPLYLTFPLKDIPVVFDYGDEVRSAILLQTPHFVECKQGACPERENLKKYFKPSANAETPQDPHYFPFADLS